MATTEYHVEAITAEEEASGNRARIGPVSAGVATSAVLLLMGITNTSPSYTTAAVATIMLTIILATWVDRRRSYPLLAFALCYGLFLTSRQIINSLASTPTDEIGLLGTGTSNPGTFVDTNLAIYLGALGLLIGWAMPIRRNEKADPASIERRTAARSAGGFLFVMCTPAQIYSYWLAVQNVSAQGFFEGRLSSAAGPLPVRVLATLFDFSFFLYLAGHPKRRPAFIACLSYVAISAISLLTLVRSDFVLSVGFLGLYLFHRQVSYGERWITARRVIISIAASPFVFAAMNTLNKLRDRPGAQGTSDSSATLEFLRSQGVSIHVVTASHELLNSIPTDRWYSFGAPIESGQRLLSLVLGTKANTYQGQTAERALEGHQFAHTISYLISPYDYVRGIGYGSSYVAELFVDFGLLGVILGSAIYAFILVRTRRLLSRGIWTTFFTLYALKGILFVPRASFVQPIADLTSLPSVIALPILAVALHVCLPKVVARAPALEEEAS